MENDSGNNQSLRDERKTLILRQRKESQCREEQSYIQSHKLYELISVYIRFDERSKEKPNILLTSCICNMIVRLKFHSRNRRPIFEDKSIGVLSGQCQDLDRWT